MKRLHQQGFSAIEAIIIVVVLVGIGAAGYEFMKMHNKSTTPTPTTTTASSTSSTQASSVAVPAAPQVKSSQDLDSALNTLNQTNLDAGSTDSSQLGSQSNGF